MEDMVNHPKHYISKNGIEVIDVITAFTDGLNGVEATDTGNIIKYACRWKKKNGVEDLKKIVWYAEHLIKHLGGVEPQSSMCMFPDDILNFKSFIEADDALSLMLEEALEHETQDHEGYTTLGFLKNLKGYTIKECDDLYGWRCSTLCVARVLRDKKKYYINLPLPSYLSKSSKGDK